MKNWKSTSDKNTFKSSTDKPNNSFYQMNKMRATERWKQLSKLIRDRWVVCQSLDQCEQPASSVHHIRDAEKRLDLFWRETNLIPMCEHHHRKADNQGVIDDNTLAKYWADKINIFRTTGKKE